jgi:hypothetical protein
VSFDMKSGAFLSPPTKTIKLKIYKAINLATCMDVKLHISN